MKRIIFFLTGPVVGMDDYVPDVFADDASDRDILDVGHDLAVEHLETYGYVFDPNDDFTDDGVVTELDYGFSIYDPEKHDRHSTTGSFEGEFRELEKSFKMWAK